MTQIAEEAFAAGKYDDACKLYSQISSLTEKNYIETYETKIEDLRNRYQAEELALENKQKKKNLLILAGAFILILTILSILFFLILHRKTAKLKVLLSEMKEATRMAQTATKNKSIFISNMTHEIKTPLNAIAGFAEVLSSNDLDHETSSQCHDVIRLNSELLLKLVDDVIDTTCFNPDDLTFRIQEVDAVFICRQILETVNQVKQNSVPLLFETSHETIRIPTDTGRLQQVITNLLVNATKFTQTGSITLSLHTDQQGNALFAVTDTGCGIPETVQDLIFERFEKLQEQVNGTGLGLAICRTIIRRLGGDIRLDKNYADGARFIFTHPVCPN